MRTRPLPMFLAVAVIAAVPLVPVCSGAEGGSGRPVTVRDLIRELGKSPAKESQLELKLEAKITGKDLGKMPKSMEVAVTYDKGENIVRVVNDSVFTDGMTKRTTTFAT